MASARREAEASQDCPRRPRGLLSCSAPTLTDSPPAASLHMPLRWIFSPYPLWPPRATTTHRCERPRGCAHRLADPLPTHSASLRQRPLSAPASPEADLPRRPVFTWSSAHERSPSRAGDVLCVGRSGEQSSTHGASYLRAPVGSPLAHGTLPNSQLTEPPATLTDPIRMTAAATAVRASRATIKPVTAKMLMAHAHLPNPCPDASPIRYQAHWRLRSKQQAMATPRPCRRATRSGFLSGIRRPLESREFKPARE